MIDHLCRQFEATTERHGPVAYYDVSTYAFESVRADELRLFGFSKDHKNNEVQVVMGLLMDEQGIPIRYSLKKAPAELQELTFDQEGWMESKDEEGRVTSRSKRLSRDLDVKRLLTEEEKTLLPVKRGRPRKYTSDVIQVAVHLTWNAERAAKDRADRERILEKVRAQAKRGRSQYVQYPAEYQEATLDEARIAWQEQFDGYYAVMTNQMELPTEEVSKIYGGLWKIEESFRVTKSDLVAQACLCLDG